MMTLISRWSFQYFSCLLIFQIGTYFSCVALQFLSYKYTYQLKKDSIIEKIAYSIMGLWVTICPFMFQNVFNCNNREIQGKQDELMNFSNLLTSSPGF